MNFNNWSKACVVTLLYGMRESGVIMRNWNTDVADLWSVERELVYRYYEVNKHY